MMLFPLPKSPLNNAIFVFKIVGISSSAMSCVSWTDLDVKLLSINGDFFYIKINWKCRL
jgi:hypothetical protein